MLDERQAKWHSRISLSSLDLSDPDECVLGQLQCCYKHGLEFMNLNEITAARLGFATLMPRPLGILVFRLLTYAWTSEILKRQAYDAEVALSYLQMEHHRVGA